MWLYKHKLKIKIFNIITQCINSPKSKHTDADRQSILVHTFRASFSNFSCSTFCIIKKRFVKTQTRKHYRHDFQADTPLWIVIGRYNQITHYGKHIERDFYPKSDITVLEKFNRNPRLCKLPISTILSNLILGPLI